MLISCKVYTCTICSIFLMCLWNSAENGWFESQGASYNIILFKMMFKLLQKYIPPNLIALFWYAGLFNANFLLQLLSGEFECNPDLNSMHYHHNTHGFGMQWYVLVAEPFFFGLAVDGMCSQRTWRFDLNMFHSPLSGLINFTTKNTLQSVNALFNLTCIDVDWLTKVLSKHNVTSW